LLDQPPPSEVVEHDLIEGDVGIGEEIGDVALGAIGA